MSLFAAAFLLGLTGSLHCLGMCGPLFLALKRNQKNQLIYQLGRILMYTIMGAVAGILGFGFAAGGWMSAVSLFTGIVLLVSALPFTVRYTKMPVFNPLDFIFRKVRMLFSPISGSPNPVASFGLGLLNGMLPCGLLYVALAGAMASGSMTYGIVFMSGFGFGTLPYAFLLIGWNSFFQKFQSWAFAGSLTRAIQIFVAILLIVRGLDLGIPWISPRWQDPGIQAAAGGCH